jgi:hypothetical protein
MNVRLLIFICLLLPFKAMALNGLWQALTITQSIGIHFGSIAGKSGRICTINIGGGTSGDCSNIDTNAASGVIILSGLTPNAQVEVTITGSDNGNLLFLPDVRISGGTAGAITLADGELGTVTVKATGDDLNIEIYGQLNLQADISSGQSHTVNYTVTANEL